MLWTLLLTGLFLFVAVITIAVIRKQPKKKIIMLSVGLMAFVALLVSVSLVLINHWTKHDSDGDIVLYPTTELVTDSFVIDSTASVWNATMYQERN